jgi:hypothetical protein
MDMDDIISKFENLSTESKKSDIDDLISKINDLDINNYFEWNRLCDNYNKLKYFKSIYSNVDIKYYESIFKKPFLIFMNKIDEVNKYYIENIILDPNYYTDGYNMYDISSIRDIIEIISNSLKKSIKLENPSTKLDYVLIAYSNIKLLIEDLEGEKCVKKRKQF